MAKTNKARRFNGGGPRPDNTKHKREEAKERAEAYNKLSVVEKIARLDSMFGVGLGAKKVRAKLSNPVENVAEVSEELANKPHEKMKAKERRTHHRA